MCIRDRSITGGVDYTDVGDMLIGKHQTGGWTLFNGSVDEVAIYNRSLTASEVRALYNAQKAKFIEYTSVNDNVGKFGDAMSFDGVDDYVEVSDAPTLNFGIEDFSLEIWFKTTQSVSFARMIDKYGPGQNVYSFDITNGKIAGYVRDTDGDAVDLEGGNAGSIVNDGNWHHAVLVRKGTTITIYLDGNEDINGSNTALDDIDTSTSKLHIGGREKSNSFNGTIDEVRIYNRALTPEEIYQHYIGWLANRTVNYPDGTTRVHKIVELNDFKEITGAAVQALSYNLSDTDWSGQLDYDQRLLRVSYESSDTEAPTYSNVGINETEPVAPNTFVKHYAYWQDSGEGLDYYIFSWTGNSSVGCGTWVNDSAVSFGGASAEWSNVTKSSTCTPTISWRIYAKDVVGNWNDTGIQTYSTNVVPSVVLISPANNTNTTNNTPTFVYNISDSDSDQTLTSIVYVQNATGIYAVGSNTTTSPASNLQISNVSNITLTDGTYTWWVNVSDGYNTNKSEVRTLVIDTTPPVVEYVSGTTADSANISQTWVFVNVSIIDSNFKNVTFYLYNSSSLVNETTYNSLLGDNTQNVNWTGLSDGSYWFNVTVYDWVESSASTVTRNVGIDTISPGIDFDSSTPVDHANISVNYVNINVSTTDSASGFIDWNRSLVGYWRFQEGSGIYANDTSTYGNNGTLHGFDCTSLDCNSSSGWTSAGKFGRGLVFDGVDDYVEIPNDESLNITGNEITIEAWIYRKQDSGQWERLISKDDDNTDYIYAMQIRADTDAIKFELDTQTTAGILNGNTPISTNQWYHVTGVYNGSQIILYLNGVVDANASLSGSINTSSGNLYIGRLRSAGSYYYSFNGIIDEVRIWNRALTPEEINASYHNGLYRLENNYTSLSDGNYEYYAYVTDEAGNVNRTPSSGFRSLTIDTVNPSLSYNSGTTQSGNLSQNYIFVNVSFSDASPSSGIKNLTYYLWNSTELVDNVSYYTPSSPNSTNFTGLVDGEYWFNVTIYDFAGNKNDTATRNVVLDLSLIHI